MGTPVAGLPTRRSSPPTTLEGERNGPLRYRTQDARLDPGARTAAGALGEADVSLPGGCAIGERPDESSTSRACRRWAPRSSIDSGYVRATVPAGSRARGSPRRSDGRRAPKMCMMAADLANGETVIENAAREPEVVDLAKFLIAMGAKIQGAGTDKIVIQGVKKAARRELRSACRTASRAAPILSPARSPRRLVRMQEHRARTSRAR